MKWVGVVKICTSLDIRQYVYVMSYSTVCFRACVLEFRHTTVNHTHTGDQEYIMDVKYIGNVEDIELFVLYRYFRYRPYQFI